jgi:hypothetical protein
MTCVVYLDNVLIFSEREEEHVIYVREVIERLRRYKLYAKVSKCEFYIKQIGFLGFIITLDRVIIEPERVKSI